METTRAPRPPVTVIVTTLNEERNIERCLNALLWCDDVFVIDSFSTDRTPEICRSLPGVRFVQREYLGASAQKNWALTQARHEWILMFDADEICTPELRQEIEEILAGGPEHDAYTIRRRAFFLGKVIRFSGWQNDKVVRLVRRGTGQFQKRRVHATWDKPGGPILNHPMDHHMVQNLHPYMVKMVRYAYWGAAQQWKNGSESSTRKIVIHTFYRFFRTYVLQNGFRDGTRGLIFCLLQSYQAFMKWSMLWSWHADAKRGIQPVLPPFEEDVQTPETEKSGEESKSRDRVPA